MRNVWGTLVSRAKVATARGAKRDTSAEFQKLRDDLKKTRHAVDNLEVAAEAYRRAAADFAAASKRFGSALRGVANTKCITRVLDSSADTRDDVLGTVIALPEELGDTVAVVASASAAQLLKTLRERVNPAVERARTLKTATYAAVVDRNALADRIDALGGAKSMDAALRAAHASETHTSASERFGSLQAAAIASMAAAEHEFASVFSVAAVDAAATTAGGHVAPGRAPAPRVDGCVPPPISRWSRRSRAWWWRYDVSRWRRQC